MPSAWDQFTAGVQKTAEDVAHAVATDPIADLQVVGGTVLVATGAGSAVGIGLIASGTVRLVGDTLSEAAKDDPKTPTPGAAQVQRTRASLAPGTLDLRAAINATKPPLQHEALVKPPPHESLLDEFIDGLEHLLGLRK